MKDNIYLTLSILFLIAILILIGVFGWYWYTASCEELKTGIMRNGVAPNRCI